jgi:hypothetical protein
MNGLPMTTLTRPNGRSRLVPESDTGRSGLPLLIAK